MSLFQCEECGGRENTATGAYWGWGKKLCSECDTGEWHGHFPKLIPPKRQFVTNKEGNLAHRETGDTDVRKYAINPQQRGSIVSNTPVMRAKMRVSNVVSYDGGELLDFCAVSRPDGYPEDGVDEDNSFARWTPSATVAMDVRNPDLWGKFAIGDTFYVDFTQVDDAPAQT
jgi:hypothetical protein